MQIDKLVKGIEAKFAQHRIVFWHDPDKSFKDEIASLELDGVAVLDMAFQSLLEVKKQIEIDEQERQFLLYFSCEEPEPERDFLLDIRLYSEQFYADASSMLLNELGISRISLRDHLRKRQSFFGNKQRFAALKRLVTENEDEQSLDRKMIAVLVKADSASLNDILLRLMADYADALVSGEAGALPTVLSKYKLLPSLWKEIEATYDYVADEPTVADFVLKLFCTDFWTQVESNNRDWLLNNVLKRTSGRATVSAFMSSWRDSRSYAAAYNEISGVLAKQLEVKKRCEQYQIAQILDCETFEVVEQAIIVALMNGLLGSSKQFDRIEFDAILSRRLGSHWCLTNKKYKAAYEALRSAELLFHLRDQYADGFHFSSAKDMYVAYTDELFKFDQAYRLFNSFAHSGFSKGEEVLRELDGKVENIYTNWYLHELGLAWDGLLAKENLIDSWSIESLNNQYQFFDKQVKERLRSKSTKRVFVIISDAMRYEVAHELVSEINKEKRFKTDLSSQLGVLPSYTQLGMASLLPHQHLSYQASKGSAVFVDGASSQGLDNRNAILQKVNGIAVSAKELLEWSNEVGREKVRGAEVVYIYHDTIDAIGDKAATEDKTFNACRTAIVELTDLISRVINRLNASRVVVTADHGFLFQQQSLVQPDKTKLKSKLAETIEAKKRYIVGSNLPTDESYWKGLIVTASNGSCETEFLLPKGNQRFHFVGGAKFVHGGAMLQEVCVPVIGINVLRGEKAAKNEKQPVGVVSAKQSIKIVNNIDKLRFIQTDAVGDEYTARQLDIYITDQAGAVVSSRETVMFDSTSQSMDDRTRTVKMKLIGAGFDRKKSYTLVLEDVGTKTRYNQYAVIIDLAFQDDFF